MLERGLRKRAGALLFEGVFEGLTRLGKLHPMAKPDRHGVQVLRDIPYATGPGRRRDHLLDVYRPQGTREGEGLPVVLYIHGGAFRMLSKDSHWIMGLSFARRGLLVFNINYRLAPEHPYPAAAVDASNALRWVLDNARAYGGDTDKLIIAGESAGANLACVTTIACCYERPEPWARALFDRGVTPRAALPACGILQVSDTQRFARRRPLPRWLTDRLTAPTNHYLGAADADQPGGLELADPLCVIEKGEEPARPLPPFFLPVGTRDPLLDDTRRMAAALQALSVDAEAIYYPGELHAFHAMIFRPAARKCWLDTWRFLGRVMPETVELAREREHLLRRSPVRMMLSRR